MPAEVSGMIRQVGNYDLLEKIAEGGMGAVYKGRNRSTGQIVAVKIIPAETARNPLLLRRFEQEFRVASLIDHPNVVKALDYSGSGSSPFLVMELVDGESLGMKIERDGPMAEADAVRVIGQVCEGLHRAHKQGLIHRDVKPDNILLTADLTAKITDLGLVKDVEGEMNLTRTGRGLGTPHFMAPEQFRNAKNADVRCDVYSLGATLYTMLTAVIPFDKTTPLDCWLKKTKNDFPAPRSLNPAVSDRADWAIRRAMSSDPASRPASCREFMEDLLGTAWRSASGSGPLSGRYLAPRPADPIADAALVGDLINTVLPPQALDLPPADLWYMVYRDATGQTRTVKGSTESIRRNLLAATLGDIAAILVSRTKTGQFQPLRSTPEFRDVALSLAAAPVRPPASCGDVSWNGVETPDIAKIATQRTSPPPAPRGYQSTQVYPVSTDHASADDWSSPFQPAARPAAGPLPLWLLAVAVGVALAMVVLAGVLALQR